MAQLARRFGEELALLADDAVQLVGLGQDAPHDGVLQAGRLARPLHDRVGHAVGAQVDGRHHASPPSRACEPGASACRPSRGNGGSASGFTAMDMSLTGLSSAAMRFELR